MMTRFSPAFALAVTVTSVPVLAHHTAASIYNVDNALQLSGIAAEVEWKQPHVIVHVDLEGESARTKPPDSAQMAS
jgi:hypothetical protein